MPEVEPDWRLITHPPADRRTIARVVGTSVMAVGVLLLLVNAVKRLDRQDLELLGVGRCLFGGFLRV